MRYWNSARRSALAGLLLAISVSGAGASGDLQRVQSLETQTGVLERQISGLNSAVSQFALTPPKPVGDATIVLAQSSRDVASVNLRLGQLEEQIRVLTGQVEGLQFQMTQVQTFMERMQEDYEFRFQQLEGGGLGKTEAAPRSGSDRLTGELPQSTNLIPDSSAVIESIDPNDPNIVIDPSAEGFELGAAPAPLGSLPSEALDLSGRPLDLNVGSGALVTEADAMAQYRAGYDAVVRGDYAFAEDQFRQFIGLFPTHPSAPEATNWLGEALILRGEYDEAADVLLTGFESYPSSTRAPDMLLKLGTALAGAGEMDTACRTFGEVERRFSDMSPSFNARLAEEISKAQC